MYWFLSYVPHLDPNVALEFHLFLYRLLRNVALFLRLLAKVFGKSIVPESQ